MNVLYVDLKDISVPKTFIFDPSTYKIEIQIEINVPDNFVFSEERREFNVSISEVDAINATGILSSVEGQSVKITVYDNDCKYSYLTCIILYVHSFMDT